MARREPETVSTLWYHDHSMDHTSENTFKGLVGFHLVFDEIDSGNENDPSPKALRLPSGEFDVPLLFQDKRFGPDGELLFDPLSPDVHSGVLGDKFTVNGAIQPINLVVKIPAGGVITNCATVNVTGDTNLANNQSCVTNTVQGPIDVGVVKTAVVSGQTVTYTLTFSGAASTWPLEWKRKQVSPP